MRPLPFAGTSVHSHFRNGACGTCFLATLVIALITACGAESDGESAEDPNAAVSSQAHLVLITISDLRIDVEHPSLTEAQPAYAPSSLPAQSAASIFTGRLPSRAGAIGLDEAQPPPSAPTLPVWLRQAGYTAAWFSQGSWGSRDGFTRGFDWVETAPESGWSMSDIVTRFDRAVGDLLSPGAQPALIAAHLDPSLAPSAEELEAGRPLEHWRKEYLQRINTTLDSTADMLRRARQAAAAADRPVVLILAGLSGFDLAEHDNGIGSGWTMHEASIRVPLLAERLEGENSALLFDNAKPMIPPSLVDLAPTLLSFAGVSTPNDDASRFDGSSWASVTDQRAEWIATAPDTPRISELVIRERNITRAVMATGPNGVLKFVRLARTVPVADRPILMRGYEEIQAAMLSGATPTPELFGPAAEEERFLLLPSDGALPHRRSDTGNEAAYRTLSSALRAYAELTVRTGYQPLALTRRLEIDPDQMRDLESLGYL